jgi:arsenate reductase-like glutaredoxin family protein
MRTVFYLGTCDTCARILKELNIKKYGFEFREIKSQGVTGKELDAMKKLSGSYESLFSRVALKYKTLKKKPAREEEYRDLIMKEYTFLKRPVIVDGDHIFIGNSKSVQQAAAAHLASIDL